MGSGTPSRGLFAADRLSPQAAAKVETLSSLFSAVAFVFGIAGLVGWRLDIPFLRDFGSHLPEIRPVSALSVALLAGVLRFGSSNSRLGRVLILLTMILALDSLPGALGSIEWLARQLIVARTVLANATPELLERCGPTPAPAALGYFFLSAAFLIARNERLVLVAQTMAVAAMFGALVPVLGFLYRIESLSSPLLPSAPSLMASVGVVLLAGGIVLLNPQRGVVGLLSSDTGASRAARRLLVPALGFPVLMGGLFLYTRQIGAIDFDAAVPTFVAALGATLAGSVLWVARSDARSEILQRRSEQALRAGADASPLMTWLTDAGGNITHANPPLCEFVGRPMEEIIGDGWRNFANAEDLANLDEESRRARRERRPFSAEVRMLHADSSWRWILSTAMPNIGPTNEISGYVGSWIDVTTRKSAEGALQRFASELEMRVSERTKELTASAEELVRQTGLLESVVQSMGDAVLAMSTDNELLMANEAAVLLLGAPGARHASGASSPNAAEYGFYLSDGKTRFATDQLPPLRAMRGENVDNVIMLIRHALAPEGVWCRVSARPIRDRDGRILGSVIVGRDVTDLEQALTATRRLAAVVESSADAILSVSPEGRITSWNKGAEQMYGYTAPEILGEHLSRLDPAPEQHGLESMLETLRSGAVVIRRDTVGLRKDRSHVDITVTMSPIHNERGRVSAVSVVHHDVSHLKEAERRIQGLNDELEQRVRDRTAALIAANHDLENYASSVAHDLRTPLRAIAGFARVMEEDYGEQIGDEGMRVINVIRKNAQDMGAFIDALLAFSAVERQPPNKETVEVASVVRECVDALTQDLGDRDIVFHIGDLPSCRADRALLKQVWMNLLTNAIKFTRPRPQARIDIGSRSDESGATAYFVRDNGVGFDMSNTRRLFGLFQRLHAPGQFEGTGLGLANVARIIAAHGGRVWAEAESGKGATFYFIVDQREGAAA